MNFNKMLIVILSVAVMGCQSKSQEGLSPAVNQFPTQEQPVLIQSPPKQVTPAQTEDCAVKFNKEDRLHLTVVKAMQMRQFCHYSEDEIKAMAKAVY